MKKNKGTATLTKFKTIVINIKNNGRSSNSGLLTVKSQCIKTTATINGKRRK